MGNVFIFTTHDARNLPERELWLNICAAQTRRRSAMDAMQRTIHLHGRNLNDDEHRALIHALQLLRNEDDGAAENEMIAYLTAAAEHKLKESAT